MQDLLRQRFVVDGSGDEDGPDECAECHYSPPPSIVAWAEELLEVAEVALDLFAVDGA